MGQGNHKYMKECSDPETDMCGIIYKSNSTDYSKLDHDTPFYKLTDVEMEIQKLWGCWQNYLVADKEHIWNIHKTTD